jgi:AraC-like DNA-binding protein
LRLEAGDLVIRPGGLDHRLQDTLENSAVPHDLLPELEARAAESLKLGGPGPLTVTLSGHFRFDVEMARPLVNALPPLIAIQTRGASPPAWLRLGIQFIADEFSTRKLAQQAVTNRIADILLIEVLRHHLESLPEGAGNWLAALRDKGLSAALAAMHAEPNRGWTVPELAEVAHLSRSAFADRFGQVMGQPPLAYLTDHRMRLAAWKLAHSRLSIAQIAEQVGYASETAFSQAFKRHHGEPPSKMRG